MSERFRVQDATGIVVDAGPTQGPLIMCTLTADIPADGSGSYALGCELFNITNGQVYSNIGTVLACKFRVLFGFVSAAFALPTGAAGYAKGAPLIDNTTGLMYRNTGTETSATWTSVDASTLGVVWLPLSDFRVIASNDIPNIAGTPAGGIAALNSLPKFLRTNAATDIALKIEWVATSVIEIQAPPILIPPDMDITKASTVKVLGLMGGATDTPTMQVKCFPGIGGTDAGGNTGAFSNALQTLSVAIAANTFAAFPTFANIGFIPGTHGTDVLRIYGAYLQYTKKLPTT